ncbi:MAG: hypothetical protein JKX81_16915 [Arenicella sp.]|nr:hypothetical protein [Arenicella sp.]
MTSQQTNSSTSAESKPDSSAVDLSAQQLSELASNIKAWGVEMGFDAVGISDGELSKHEAHLNKWLEKGMQGEMDYMHKHGSKRTNPDQLVVGTKRVISVRMDYAPVDIMPLKKY